VAALPQIAPGKLLFALDTPGAVPITPEEAYIKGWFVPGPDGPRDLCLLIGNERIPAFYGLPRRDVARHHANDPRFKYSGFVAHIPLGPMPASARLAACDENESPLVLVDHIAVPARTAEPSHQRSISLLRSPRISLLIPLRVWRRDYPYLLNRSLQSIRRQSYRNVQICLIGAAEDSFSAWQNFARAEDKIVAVEHLREAQGDFVIFLNPGDELQTGALEEFAAAFENDADLAYSDETEINYYGERTREIAKPDFDSEAFRSWNFMGRGIAVRRSVLPVNAPLDWAGLKSFTDQLGPARIRHIAQPLYCTRKSDEAEMQIPGAPRTQSTEAPDASEHGVRVEPGLFPGSWRLRQQLPADCAIAVILRPEDGLFQKAVLAPAADSFRVRFYTKLPQNCAEDVLIFVHGPLDTVNHWFIEELASQALRADCRAVTGISLDRNGRILHAGLRRKTDGGLSDAFAGMYFADKHLPSELSVVRSAEAISKLFFAVKRERLDPHEDAEVITRSDELKLLVTPYAVATFDMLSNEMSEQGPSPESTEEERVAQLASDRNYLRRELERTREALRRLEASRCEDLKERIAQLEAALRAQTEMQAELTNSLSWKITAPLRACMRLVRGR
jgi:hypothetical protein